MNTETKIAFRAVISEVLLYMVEPGRDQNEILTVLDKLEKVTSDLIHLEMLASMPDATEYKMKVADRIVFRGQIAAILEVMSRHTSTPETLLLLVKDMEKWIEGLAEEQLRIFAHSFGKPKMKIIRLPN
jgi:hypothetical protein